MRLAMIGLGRMGGNMVRRLLQDDHEVVVWDLSAEAVAQAVERGATAVSAPEDLRDALPAPRAVWIMVPAGDATRATIDRLAAFLEPGDVIIDGGNSNFRDSIATAKQLAERGIGFMDAGVSGGIWGLAEGYCLMVGAEPEAFEVVKPALETLAPPEGLAHVGPPGSGHFTKMVHNGIEYGLMQAYAEGFELMHASPDFDLDLHQIAKVWKHGSVVRSWLLDLTERALGDNAHFDRVRGVVPDSGEGRWTVQEAVNCAVPLPVITAALFARFASREKESFAARITAALRNQFGGHELTLTQDVQTAVTTTVQPQGSSTDPPTQ